MGKGDIILPTLNFSMGKRNIIFPTLTYSNSSLADSNRLPANGWEISLLFFPQLNTQWMGIKRVSFPL